MTVLSKEDVEYYVRLLDVTFESFGSKAKDAKRTVKRLVFLTILSSIFIFMICEVAFKSNQFINVVLWLSSLLPLLFLAGFYYLAHKAFTLYELKEIICKEIKIRIIKGDSDTASLRPIEKSHSYSEFDKYQLLFKLLLLIKNKGLLGVLHNLYASALFVTPLYRILLALSTFVGYLWFCIWALTAIFVVS